MKLLIFTQKVDSNDPVLGFFHGWILKFSEKFDRLFVVCLEKGEFNLPENVEVFSLGKDEGVGRFVYIVRFFKFVFFLRNKYDAVFVHMNQEYILLGGIIWRILGKRIGFWYNHTYGTWKTRIAMRLASIIFHTSPYAYTAGSKKSLRMPAGINVDVFTPPNTMSERSSSILYVGRIAPVKGLHVLLDAIAILQEKNIPAELDIYGGALSRDRVYREDLERRAKTLNEGSVRFHGSVSNIKTPEIYRRHEVFVNLTPSGNYDKTILEALACETKALVSSEAFVEDLPASYRFRENDPEDLAKKLQELFHEDNQKQREELRAYVRDMHGMAVLSERLYAAMKN